MLLLTTELLVMQGVLGNVKTALVLEGVESVQTGVLSVSPDATFRVSRLVREPVNLRPLKPVPEPDVLRSSACIAE